MRRVPAIRAAAVALAAVAVGAWPSMGSPITIDAWPAGDPPLARLVSPADGEVLAGGGTAVVEWAPAPGLAALPHAEEWEAFLSLDGGITYPIRLTPHLDLAVRRFAVRLPDLPAAQARLMLRFGDERREVSFEAPARLSIAPSIGMAAIMPRRLHLGRGEPARAGEAGVVAWVEGGRRGDGLEEAVAAGVGAAWRGVRPSPELLLLAPAPAPDRVALSPPADRGPAPPPSPRFITAPLPREALPVSGVRLLIHRFNE